MGFWGKIIGGAVGFAMGGPLGAVLGSALGHAADEGGLAQGLPGVDGARIAAMLGSRESLFAISVIVLSAKLAKCDGPVTREEIDAFKRLFRIPPESLREIGQLFDQARDSADDYRLFARRLGEAFADNKGMLEDVLAALFQIARADGPLTKAEVAYLQGVQLGFGLEAASWERARDGRTQQQAAAPAPAGPDDGIRIEPPPAAAPGAASVVGAVVSVVWVVMVLSLSSVVRSAGGAGGRGTVSAPGRTRP